MNPETDEYRVSAEGMERLAWTRGLWTFALIFGFVVLLVLSRGRSADDAQRLHLVIFGLIVMLMAVVVIFIAGERLEKGWSTYRLWLESDSIARFKKGLDPMRLRRSEITKIQEAPGTGLTLRTELRFRRLFIPAQLVGYEHVRDVLSQWQTLQVLPFSRRALSKCLALGLAALGLAAWGVCVGATDVRVVVASVLVFYGLAALGVWEHQRNPNFTSAQKLLFWILLLLESKFWALPFLKMCTVFAR